MVIPALNEADWIVGAIESARAPGVEVLVSDGGSVDSTRARAEGAGARVIVGPAGRARQLSAGFRESRGDALLFLHADTRLPPGFEKAVSEAFADTAVVGGAFRFRFDQGGPALRLVEWGARLRVKLFGIPYGDQALFVRRDVLDAIGGVPQVPIMEDLDLVAALRRRGRLAMLALPATTSVRRYRDRGVLRTTVRNWVGLIAWLLGADRAHLAAWYDR